MNVSRLSGIMLMICTLVAPVAFSQRVAAQTRDEQVRADKVELADNESWYYDDFEKATEVALAEKKPMMVVLRCIP